MPIQGAVPQKFHGKIRRRVVATADVEIQQVQVVDKTGQIRSLVVWRCGPDVMYSDTMDGLFDSTRRRTAPTWLVDQISNLPDNLRLDCAGVPKGVEPLDEEDPEEISLGDGHVPSEVDDDLPAFVQG